MTRQPTFYIPHGGGPCFFMDWSLGPKDTWDPLKKWLRRLPKFLPETPKLILIISGHWEANLPTLTSSLHPKLIYDYSGFPRHTYKLKWPAPGSPEMAHRVVEVLVESGLSASLNPSRGWDHGVFIPLKVAFPTAQIPTIQLSMIKGLDAAQHLDLGRALAPLRDEGVLIIGSGMSYHNMKKFLTSGALQQSIRFDDWLVSTLAEDQWTRDDLLVHWRNAPGGAASHPNPDHLLPLMVVAGAAEDDQGLCKFTDTVMGARVSGFQFG